MTKAKPKIKTKVVTQAKRRTFKEWWLALWGGVPAPKKKKGKVTVKPHLRGKRTPPAKTPPGKKAVVKKPAPPPVKETVHNVPQATLDAAMARQQKLQGADKLP